MMDAPNGFNPSRLTLARKRRGLTKTRLAKEVGVEPRSITAYESGEFGPDEERLQKLASVLRFQLGFFQGDDLDEPSPDCASFRALTKMTASQRDIALGCGAVALMLNEWIEKRFELPIADLPDLSGTDPEAAAYMLRQQWGLGELPIKNMIHLLEARGVRIFSLAIDATTVDAYSMWRGRTPFVFLNTNKSAEHSRFDSAHELGHLVLHRHGSPQGQAAEREANAFASAFLMPRASVLAHAPKFPTIEAIIERKKIWSVSVAALNYRLHTLELLSEWHYRSLCIDIAKRGFRTQEPFEIKRETSQIYAKVFSALRDEGISKRDIANELSVLPEEVEQLVFGLVITGVSGDKVQATINPQKRPNLRLVR
jgi:Zn-dependent peptidase ImmA (M78 family)/DNA-binding XRE family transcriptional regulator